MFLQALCFKARLRSFLERRITTRTSYINQVKEVPTTLTYWNGRSKTTTAPLISIFPWSFPKSIHRKSWRLFMKVEAEAMRYCQKLANMCAQGLSISLMTTQVSEPRCEPWAPMRWGQGCPFQTQLVPAGLSSMISRGRTALVSNIALLPFQMCGNFKWYAILSRILC